MGNKVIQLLEEIKLARGDYSSLAKRLDDRLATLVEFKEDLPSPGIEGRLYVIATDITNGNRPTIYLFKSGEYELVSGAGGGGGGDPELENRVRKLENNTNTMVREFREDFLTESRVDKEKTTAVVGAGYVRTEKVHVFEEDFTTTNNINQEWSRNIHVDTDNRRLTLADPSFSGELISKEIVTEGTSFAKVDVHVVHDEALSFSSRELVSEPKTVDQASPFYVYDRVGRLWILWEVGASGVGFRVINPDGTKAIEEGFVSTVAGGRRLKACVDYDNRVWVFTDDSARVYYTVLNPDGSVGISTTTVISWVNIQSYDVLVDKNNRVWVCVCGGAGSSGRFHLGIRVFKGDGSSFYSSTVEVAPYTPNSSSISMAYESVKGYISVVVKYVTGNSSHRRLVTYGFNENGSVYSSMKELLNSNTYNTFIGYSYYDSQKDRFVTIQNLSSGVLSFFELNPSNLSSTRRVNRTLSGMLTTYISVYEDDEYLHVLYRKTENKASLFYVVFEKQDFSIVRPPIRVNDSVDDGIGYASIIRGVDGNIKVAYNALYDQKHYNIFEETFMYVPTRVRVYLSNDQGVSWQEAESGEFVYFNELGNKIIVKMELESPSSDVTPEVLGYVVTEGNNEGNQSVQREFYSAKLPSVLPISKARVSAEQELNGGTIEWFVSNNGGGDWEPLILDQEVSFPNTLGNDLRVKAVLTAPKEEPLSPIIREYTVLSSSVITASDLHSIQVNLMKTNFKVDTSMNASRNAMKNLVIDVFNDESGIDQEQSSYVYDATNRSIKEGVVVSKAEPSPFVPTTILLSADYSLNEGSIVFEVSRDGGNTWSVVTPDVIHNISLQPSGSRVVARATLTGDAELRAWGYSWS